MTPQELYAQARAESNNPASVRHGAPFWNVESQMFQYVPAFCFPVLKCSKNYRYEALAAGKTYSFFAKTPKERLTPIWDSLPTGAVTLTVTACEEDGTPIALVGARTFFKSDCFPGACPPAASSYTSCAVRAYRFAFDQPFVRHWMKFGTPDPHYDLNVYPSKMISSLVSAMLSFARVSPEDASQAMTVAVRAADYLISVTPKDGPMAHVPPTYYPAFCPDADAYGIHTVNWDLAMKCIGTVMMIYPADAANAYLELFEATGNEIYRNEAVAIGRFYQSTVGADGSWPLVVDEKTGESRGENRASPMGGILSLFRALERFDNDAAWRSLAETCLKYVEEKQLKTYNWEGQFEDTAPSAPYVNLTHFSALALATDYLEFFPNDAEKRKTALELIRFGEDQFVLWKSPMPWRFPAAKPNPPYDTKRWIYPCALEQYGWHVPIDGSATAFISAFMTCYRAGLGELWLEKARALTDAITRSQHENGQIPTHWMNTPDAEANFWFNCMFASCRTLEKMVPYERGAN